MRDSGLRTQSGSDRIAICKRYLLGRLGPGASAARDEAPGGSGPPGAFGVDGGPSRGGSGLRRADAAGEDGIEQAAEAARVGAEGTEAGQGVGAALGTGRAAGDDVAAEL